MEFSEDTHFSQVVAECANPERPHGWISAEIAEAYERLHKLGWAHSVEVWVDGDLAGGLYGLSIGNFFAGESMFHRSTDASKAAVAYLAEKMNGLPNALFDVQWLTPHLETLGAIEISREDYVQQLNASTAHTTSQRW